ncbi:hypothetical protein RhiJN_22569 [Ceratobasidium sp. AG-Ba]|nr:hypothetical protein RhiJN_22569 [Ceratobasidium sp. AG-Ba]
MSLPDGSYQIFSMLKSSRGKQLRIARRPDSLIVVDDYSEAIVRLSKTGEDKYTIRFPHRFDECFGPSEDVSEDNRVFSRSGEYEWSIYSIGNNRYKIHVPANDLYWQLPDGAENESQIFLVNSEGTYGEFWNFKRK